MKQICETNKKNQLGLIETENLFSAKTILRRWEDRPQTGRKYLQTTYVTKDLYLEYIKNCQNATVRKQTIQIENGQKKWTDISPKMINGELLKIHKDEVQPIQTAGSLLRWWGGCKHL